MSKNLPDNLFETPNTPIKEFFEEIDPGARYSDEAIALFAIVKGLQTLNRTLKELNYEDEWGCEYLRVRLDSTDRGTLGADGT